MSKRRLNVQDAAEVLGISVDAVRMRARRGSLESEHEDGRLYVWLDTDETSVKDATERVRNAAERELVEELREQVAFLRSQLQQEREENRRKDHLLAAALERIPPQLEPPKAGPSEPRESRETASEGPAGTQAPPEEEKPSSWWRRWF